MENIEFSPFVLISNSEVKFKILYIYIYILSYSYIICNIMLNYIKYNLNTNHLSFVICQM